MTAQKTKTDPWRYPLIFILAPAILITVVMQMFFRWRKWL